jgi:hypothetical protein
LRNALGFERRRFAEVRLSYDCRCLVQFCDDARQMYRELGFTSAERMIRDGYGLEAEEVSLVVEWLRLNPPNEPVSFDAAKAVLNANGGDRRSAEFQVDNIKLKHKGGTDREYVLARLRRDSPHLADEVEAGHLSANAAAIQAATHRTAAQPSARHGATSRLRMPPGCDKRSARLCQAAWRSSSAPGQQQRAPTPRPTSPAPWPCVRDTCPRPSPWRCPRAGVPA